MSPEGSEIFHSREIFFSVSPFASEGKRDELGKEFTIAEGTAKVCLLQFRLEDLRKCVSDRISLQVVVIWLNAFTSFNDSHLVQIIRWPKTTRSPFNEPCMVPQAKHCAL